MKKRINKFLRNLFRNQVEYIDPLTSEIAKGHLVAYVSLGMTKGRVAKKNIMPPVPIMGCIVEPSGKVSDHLVIPSVNVKVL